MLSHRQGHDFPSLIACSKNIIGSVFHVKHMNLGKTGSREYNARLSANNCSHQRFQLGGGEFAMCVSGVEHDLSR